MSELSNYLATESKKYVKEAKSLNLLQYRKYAAPLIVFVVVILIIYIRHYYF